MDVPRGSTVGIVGSNGAGKSTLLQIVCGTLQPDGGTVEVNGRISALLELGASFNPEFTGRENVRISSLLVGIDTVRQKQKFAEILAFADIGDFIDRPVKTYSSGMFARLAFAVAINVDPDILIIDEALAVGDEAFQRKCFARLDHLKSSGVTILFVSHSARAVQELCDHAVFLYKGECILSGHPKDVITQYQRLIYAAPADHAGVLDTIRRMGRGEAVPGERAVGAQTPGKAQKRAAEPPREYFDPGLISKSTEYYVSRGAVIEDVWIETRGGRKVNVIRGGEEYLFRYRVAFLQDASKVRFAMTIKSINGLGIGAQWTAPRGEGTGDVAAGSVATVTLPFLCRLNPGTYFCNAGLEGQVDGEPVIMHRIIDGLMFRIDKVGKTRTDYHTDLTCGSPDVTFMSGGKLEPQSRRTHRT
nr:ABC transporter ATP-binding protein [Mesorhizobium camelthorni]